MVTSTEIISIEKIGFYSQFSKGEGTPGTEGHTGSVRRQKQCGEMSESLDCGFYLKDQVRGSAGLGF